MSKMRFIRRGLWCVLVLAGSVSAQAEDPGAATLAAGGKLFLKCRSCHTLTEDGENGTGPTLHGVFGAKAGSNPDFAYSDAVKKSGIVWSEDTIGQWLASPTGFLPGNKMAFVGLPNEADRSALLAYLRKKTSE